VRSFSRLEIPAPQYLAKARGTSASRSFRDLGFIMKTCPSDPFQDRATYDPSHHPRLRRATLENALPMVTQVGQVGPGKPAILEQPVWHKDLLPGNRGIYQALWYCVLCIVMCKAFWPLIWPCTIQCSSRKTRRNMFCDVLCLHF